MTWTPGEVDELHKCGKTDCYRLVSPVSIFCCSPCALASEGSYEIHQHSPGCDKRDAERTATIPNRQETP